MVPTRRHSVDPRFHRSVAISGLSPSKSDSGGRQVISLAVEHFAAEVIDTSDLTEQEFVRQILVVARDSGMATGDFLGSSPFLLGRNIGN